ncbi:MAG TPA: SDR family oxidoreductase [Spirochaetota bacterium]|nr:SDR family oxidoreductase [Spirochaetota bacterium]HPC40735.1 SDR family oxidoreductase [Spirochaetota bacterium]HPL18542.1 SDR family oxidoreductase [Spirochaetota bacterium]HQF09356.1 SDR family oxidoreductase [Spirochaetota bacterium]HQH98030.1 SDR family oxidoreductase [Spirochaetota bacterium]
MATKYYSGKRVYVTGGSSGIGLEIARQLAPLGADLALFARNAKKLEEARAEVKRSGGKGRVEIMPLDVSDNVAVMKIIDRAVREFGVPDIIINSAGIGSANYFENISYDEFDRVMKINLYGTRNVIAAALPYLKERGSGVIVNISSMAGFSSIFGYTSYATSKFALVGFSEALRSELVRYGVTVLLACPPETDTPFLAEEGKTIPPECRAMKDLMGTLKSDYVARFILRGVARGKYLIMPGYLSRFLYLVQRFSPGWVSRMVADSTVARAARKIKN